MHFNEYLKSCREHNHLTQEQLVHDLYSYDIDTFEGLDHSNKVAADNVKIKSYRQTLANVLAFENAIKMFLSKQECPEE